jgi:hypothetical protein
MNIIDPKQNPPLVIAGPPEEASHMFTGQTLPELKTASSSKLNLVPQNSVSDATTFARTISRTGALGVQKRL